MQVKIEESWKKVLEGEFEKNYFTHLAEFIKAEYKSSTIYPPPKFIFRAFDLTPFDKVKVVILGQDPYHGDGQANGLAFAVAQGVRPPPSLQNIYKKIKSDLNCVGDINQWPSQGVLLLNSTLTVQAHQAGSHQNIGWEKFTGAVIRTLSEQKDHLVFILWGNYAKQKGQVIDTSKHLVISSPHPSPFSAYTGFFGSRPFSKCNAYLESHSLAPIDW